MSERMADALFRIKAKEAESLHARIAQLEEKLRALVDAADKVHHWHDWGRENEGMVVSANSVHSLWEATESARAALSSPPGEWLEGKMRAAQIAVLEAQPCHITHEKEQWHLCPRCRALAGLKGGRG